MADEIEKEIENWPLKAKHAKATGFLDYEDAKNAYKEAIALQSQTNYPPEKSSKIFFDYAELLVFEIKTALEIDQEPVEEALSLYQKCLDAYRKSDIDSAALLPKIAKILTRMGYLHVHLTMYDLAEENYTAALGIYRDLSAENQEEVYLREVAYTLMNLGSLHERVSNYEKAEREYWEAMSIFRSLEEISYAYLSDITTAFNKWTKLLEKIKRVCE